MILDTTFAIDLVRGDRAAVAKAEELADAYGWLPVSHREAKPAGETLGESMSKGRPMGVIDSLIAR